MKRLLAFLTLLAVVLTAGVNDVTADETGTATWFCLPGVSDCTAGYPAGGMYAAAGSELRVGDWRGSRVVVSANGRRVVVQLVDTCLCQGARIIDLYARPFSKLAPLARGVVPVVVSPATALPPTDTG